MFFVFVCLLCVFVKLSVLCVYDGVLLYGLLLCCFVFVREGTNLRVMCFLLCAHCVCDLLCDDVCCFVFVFLCLRVWLLCAWVLLLMDCVLLYGLCLMHCVMLYGWCFLC